LNNSRHIKRNIVYIVNGVKHRIPPRVSSQRTCRWR
jgi:hypothetical protein